MKNRTLLCVVPKILIVAVLICTVLIGCDNSLNNPPLSNTSEVTQTNDGQLAEFLEIIPDAVIEDYMQTDIDSDGKDDLIVIFTSEDLDRTSGLAVFINDSLCSAIDLSGEKKFHFSSGITLDNSSSTPVISVNLYDNTNSIEYRYDIEYTIDRGQKLTNFKIFSEKIES